MPQQCSKKHKCKAYRSYGDNPGFRKRIQYIETLKRDSNWNKDGIEKNQYLQLESSKESLPRRINQVENRRSEHKDKLEDFYEKKT